LIAELLRLIEEGMGGGDRRGGEEVEGVGELGGISTVRQRPVGATSEEVMAREAGDGTRERRGGTPTRGGITPLSTLLSPRGQNIRGLTQSALQESLTSFRPAGEIRAGTGKPRKNVWNEASLRLKDALGL
jgi:hypothetical protein